MATPSSLASAPAADLGVLPPRPPPLSPLVAAAAPRRHAVHASLLLDQATLAALTVAQAFNVFAAFSHPHAATNSSARLQVRQPRGMSFTLAPLK